MSSRVKWSICLLLFGATLLNYLDRQTISISASAIAEEMHLSDRDLGRLFFGFLFSYGLAQLFVGPLLDRFRSVPAYAVAVLAWSLAGASSALATGFVGFFCARMVLGVFEAPNWPLALRVTSRIFPPAQRSLAIGIFQSGSSLGVLVAPPAIIWLTHQWGWRTAFVACGAVGLVWTALWLTAARGIGDTIAGQSAPPEPAEMPDVHTRGTGPATLQTMLRSPAFWGLVMATSLVNPLQYLYTTWLPRYFTTHAGVTFGKELAARLMLVYFALDLGLWLGGGGVALLSRRLGVGRSRLLVAGVGTLGMCAIPLVTLTGNIDHITAIICASMFGLGSFLVIYLSLVAELSATRVAMAAGLLGGIGSLMGAGFMLVVGDTVEVTHGFNLIFLISGVMPVGAFAGLIFSARASRRQAEALANASVLG